MKILKNMLKKLTLHRKAMFFIGATIESQNLREPNVRAEKSESVTRDTEKYFRPSCRPILNNRFLDYHFFQPYYEKTYQEIVLPPSLLNTPENTIINYFSILREAENLTSKQIGGCGTVGESKIPFPIAYNFFTKNYQKKVSYSSFLQSFKGIGHINLIKLNKLPVADRTIQYFIELETIEGSSKNLTYFAYYYGYVTIKKEHNIYKIADISLIGEDFLCAAYHLWQHNAEAVVDVEYGNWCKLVKKRVPTKIVEYVKTIDIVGTDGNEYRFVFFQLTNDTDVLTAQYRKNVDKIWEIIHIDPINCLQENH